MKIIILLCFVLSLPIACAGQFGLRHDPKEGYEMRIRQFIDSLEIVDTHEHLSDPNLIRKSTICDFTLLYHQFANHDLISSGMPGAEFWNMLNGPLTPREKWKILKPYIDKSFNTSFNRIANLAASKLFGIENINELTVGTLSDRIKKAYQGDWFRLVLNDKCRISYVIQDTEDRSYYPDDKFRYLNRFDKFIFINSKNDIYKLKTNETENIETLDGLVNLMTSRFYESMNRDVVGIKIHLAYNRSLNFENVKKEKAKKIFNELFSSSQRDSITFQEVKPLQDYMMHHLLNLVIDSKLPVQIHTGFQSGNSNSIKNSDPVLLSNLFAEYPTINFVLLHGSYPYGGELATLAKNYPNVFIDLAWLYAISPSFSKRYLSEWLETVPANKIMAFGGDYHNIENVYAELLVAREVISEVLIDKVREGYFNEAEAMQVASMILYDNAVTLYNLSGKTPLHRITQIPGQ